MESWWKIFSIPNLLVFFYFLTISSNNRMFFIKKIIKKIFWNRQTTSKNGLERTLIRFRNNSYTNTCRLAQEKGMSSCTIIRRILAFSLDFFLTWFHQLKIFWKKDYFDHQNFWYCHKSHLVGICNSLVFLRYRGKTKVKN